jgi:hypothetical protein
MTNLKKLLKKSVKKARKGESFEKLTPADLPKGLKTTREGEFILPKQPAECADLLYAVREERLAFQRRADRLKEAETALSDWFIENLPRSSATGVAGKRARVQIETRPIPVVDGEAGWSRLHEYIVKNDAWELLQKRLGEGAAKELLDAGEGGKAGLTVFQAKKVSCTKI